MKNEYTKASMDIIELNADDIVRTSDCHDANTCTVFGEPCEAYEPM